MLNRSFDAEFNVVEEYRILIEKIHSENCGKKRKKHGMLHNERQFVIFDEVFSRLKSIGKTG